MLPARPPIATVVVELTLNDRVAHTFDAPERRAYEQLLRKALRLPGAPPLPCMANRRARGAQQSAARGLRVCSAPHTHRFLTVGRRSLLPAGPPALLLLHSYAWWIAFGDGLADGLFYPITEGQLTLFSQVPAGAGASAACAPHTVHWPDRAEAVTTR